MKNDNELAEEVLRRVRQMERQDAARGASLKRTRAVAACVICLAAVVGLSFLLPSVPDSAVPASPDAASAAMIAGVGIGRDILIGVIGFILGAALVLFCVKRRGRN